MIGPAITNLRLRFTDKLNLKLYSGVGKDTKFKQNDTYIIKVLLLSDYTTHGLVTCTTLFTKNYEVLALNTHAPSGG